MPHPVVNQPVALVTLSVAPLWLVRCCRATSLWFSPLTKSQMLHMHCSDCAIPTVACRGISGHPVLWFPVQGPLNLKFRSILSLTFTAPSLDCFLHCLFQAPTLPLVSGSVIADSPHCSPLYLQLLDFVEVLSVPAQMRFILN